MGKTIRLKLFPLFNLHFMKRAKQEEAEKAKKTHLRIAAISLVVVLDTRQFSINAIIFTLVHFAYI